MRREKDHNRITKGGADTLNVGAMTGIPDLTGAAGSLEQTGAYFLGPRAENQQLMEDLFVKGMAHVQKYRRDYLPGDPEVITPEVKATPGYRQATADIHRNLDDLLTFFDRYATPFFSLRYQAHMLWDTTLPGMAGYFAGMLHNPNNVTMQASTSTTPLEIVACKDLCYMVGFRDDPDATAEPFAHLTGDGSLSVEEATWATREMKFLPFAVRKALELARKARKKSDKYYFLKPALKLDVKLTDGKTRCFLSRGKSRKATDWELFNVRMDDILALPGRMAEMCGVDSVYDVWNPVEDLNMNAVGWHELWPYCSNKGRIKIPNMVTPSTKHYSWPKSGALLGIGWQGVHNVYVDAMARMDLALLRKFLKQCLKNKTPLLTVTCVFGSTEESAVDPLADVIAMREEFRKKGLEFNIHVDGAWGGYLTSVVRKPYTFDEDPSCDPFITDVKDVPLSDYVIEQIRHLRFADSLTIDPHKYGYIQYPAGSILYRNGTMKTLTTFSGAYIGGGGTVDPGSAPTVGCFGLEGSRPGASASAVFLSHMCIRPDVNGYGKIISESLWNTRKFYARLLFLATENFETVMLAPLPAEQNGGDVAAQKAFIKERIVGKSTEAIRNDPEAMALFKEIGPDQCIVDYAFNFYEADGKTLNRDPELFQQFNNEIYREFSLPDVMFPTGAMPEGGDEEIVADQDIHDKTEDGEWRYAYLVTQTEFERTSYGDAFVDTFAKRLGLPAKKVEALYCTRSVVMDPYVSDTVDGSYFEEILRIMHKRIDAIAAKYRNR